MPANSDFAFGFLDVGFPKARQAPVLFAHIILQNGLAFNLDLSNNPGKGEVSPKPATFVEVATSYFKTGFFVILNEVKDLSVSKTRDSSLRSE
ncbi:MAG: hypothetical protein NTY36_12590 [Deltaproteobacteria bacterium]|nr:hypothetical protein [Deltaproteobacteria bacterium]